MRTALAGLLLAAVFATVAGATSTPRLWVAHARPITIAGAGFPHGAAVAVSLRAGKVKHARIAYASSTGRFSVSFAPLPTYLGCRALSVVATAKTAATTAVVLRFTVPGSSRDCAPKQPVTG